MPRPLRVLVVDDEKPVAAGLQGQLDALGYDVVALAHDGHHAIDVCRRTQPDLVIMDIEMPGLDGLAAARPDRARTRAPRSSSSPLTATPTSSSRRSRTASSTTCSSPSPAPASTPRSRSPSPARARPRSCARTSSRWR